ncbi:hypothetical protein C6502_13840 [Candidatus Poribacteria bacterium]|nr:MAG: hypothetical protein C6502_13840 [Candidatus Poribacteria bacterium]
MTILELVFAAYKVAGGIASIIGGIDFALRRFSKSTAEDLFKKSFIDAVKQSAPKLAHFTENQDPKTVSVDTNTLDDVITSLKDINIATLTSLEEDEKLIKITALFHKCIILPGHQLTTEDLEREIQPVLEKTIANFYSRLPLNQEASNQIELEMMKAQLKSQTRLIENTQAIKNDTDKIREMTEATHDAVLGSEASLTDASNRYLNVSIADIVAKEHQFEIDNARDLLKKSNPQSALELLESLKQRIWTDASPIVRFRLLTNMAAAELILNKEQEAARLLLEAFQYNREDEIALSNRAAAHFLLGDTDEAEAYVQKTLEQNPANTDAYLILIQISTDEETLEEIIAKVPEYLRQNPQIAYAISEIARQRRHFEEARRWGEIMVEHEQEDIPDPKAALATVLVEQVLKDDLAVLTKQLNDVQEEQLRRAIELFTEAWDCVANTELRTLRTGWIINRGTAYCHLGVSQEAIKDFDTALEIEPSHPVPLKNRAILAFEQGDNKSAIEFLEQIQPNPEIPEIPILLADILRADKQFNKAITILNDFLMTDSSLELQEDANRLLINTYIADGRFKEAQQISTAMRESSPTNILALIDAARISKATGETDEALSLLKEAYDYAKNSDTFKEIVELADELYIYKQFKEAATLYEKFANTSLNSQLTQSLLYSYYHSGEREKTLAICQSLRETSGPLKNISKMEFFIYNEIGDMNQARAVCEVYINAFPDDIEMQIHLAVVHSRSNKLEEVDRLLERSFDLENLSLRSCLDLVYLYRIRSKPEKALDIMYETRRMHYDDPEAHLKYVGLFYTVTEQVGELLHTTQVQPGTAVCLESSGETYWYVIEEREDTDVTRKELYVEEDRAKRLLGKVVNDEICIRQTPFGPEIGKITDIKSKYIYAFQESFRAFPKMFPDTPGLWSIKLDDSHETGDSAKFQPLFDFINRQHEASLQIEEMYKENPLPIGAFPNLTGSNVIDTWMFLMSKPDLGVRCSTGDLEEKRQALALLGRHQVRLVVDLISLMTIHSIGAADAVIKAFGKLGIAQLTIDGLQDIINEREAMSLKREGMSVGKQGDQYVRIPINPEYVRQEVEYLKNIIKWTRENCEVHPCTAALEMNKLRKQELDNALQPFFIDTLLIASQPGHLLLSDDEPLRSYAKTNFNIDAGTNFHIDGVWTQIVLEHCVNKNFLDKFEYDEMTIKLVSAHYYQTDFDADLLIQTAKESDWNPSERYNILIQTLGHQRTNALSALDIAVDFLFELWMQSILIHRRESLTFNLLEALTSGREARAVLIVLADRIRNRPTLNYLAKQNILSEIKAYAQTRLS